MANEFRYPRIMGITPLMAEYHKTGDPDTLEKIKSYIINQWLLNNGRLSGKDFELLALAQFLNCSPEDIRIQMRDNFLSTKVWDKEHQEELLNHLMGTQLVWAMEDRMEVEKQLDLLKKSQGDKYKPFVTSEVNKVIGLKLNSSTNLQSLVRSISGGGSINIFNQVNTQQNNAYLSKEEAFKMIEESNKPLLEGNKEVMYIQAHHDIESLPEVVATKQQGISESKENTNLNVGELKEITDHYSKDDDPDPVILETRHDTRRADLLDIDLDALPV